MWYINNTKAFVITIFSLPLLLQDSTMSSFHFSSPSFCLLFSFLCLFLLSSVQVGLATEPSISLGSKLSASESNRVWVSANGTFAIGFTRFKPTDRFLLSIWFAQLPGDPTIVWSPNRYTQSSDFLVSANSSINYFLTQLNYWVPTIDFPMIRNFPHYFHSKIQYAKI